MAKPNHLHVVGTEPEILPHRPSHGFLRLTRNPALASPKRFEPTVKRVGDIVI